MIIKDDENKTTADYVAERFVHLNCVKAFAVFARNHGKNSNHIHLGIEW